MKQSRVNAPTACRAEGPRTTAAPWWPHRGDETVRRMASSGREPVAPRSWPGHEEPAPGVLVLVYSAVVAASYRMVGQHVRTGRTGWRQAGLPGAGRKSHADPELSALRQCTPGAVLCLERSSEFCARHEQGMQI
jgi:hypothetical protein